ncbi:MAG: zinc metallopeptidase [Bacillota bacterium]|nr:zinc metallopeptidase [Bacillota bacterium]
MFFPFFYDPTFILILPALIFAMIAQSRVQSTFARYLRVRSRAGVTGAQAAAGILSSSGLHHVSIEQTPHTLGDHYDPRTNTLRLSPQVYGGSSLASIAVAAHEAGHALQHREGYAPLQFRQTLLPVASIGSNLAVPLFILGFLFSAGRGSFGEFLMNLGIWLFVGAVAFQIVTLPVEFNASKRALALLADNGYITRDEIGGAREVLEAAALTYVAATAVAISQLFRLLVLRGSRRD